MRFLFRLDLSLHAGAGKKIWNLDFRNQTRPQLSWLQIEFSSSEHHASMQPRHSVKMQKVFIQIWDSENQTSDLLLRKRILSLD